MSSISDLITAAIAGAEEENEVIFEQEKTASAYSHSESFDLQDAEKVASALDLIANTGFESFVKEAAENMTHHSALSSNESAIGYGPEVRNQMINPVLGQYYSNAKGENIHTKSIVKKASDAEEQKRLIKAALAAKLQERGI